MMDYNEKGDLISSEIKEAVLDYKDLRQLNVDTDVAKNDVTCSSELIEPSHITNDFSQSNKHSQGVFDNTADTNLKHTPGISHIAEYVTDINDLTEPIHGHIDDAGEGNIPTTDHDIVADRLHDNSEPDETGLGIMKAGNSCARQQDVMTDSDDQAANTAAVDFSSDRASVTDTAALNVIRIDERLVVATSTNISPKKLSAEYSEDGHSKEKTQNTHVLAELGSMQKIYAPIKSTGRIQYNSIAVSKSWLALGTTTGAIYLFSRQDLTYKLVVPSEKEGKITLLSLASNNSLIGYATSTGLVFVVEISASGQCNNVRTSSLHQGVGVTALSWSQHCNRLYVGDHLGKVSVVNVPTNKPRDLLRLATEVIMRLDSHIVQIDAHYDHILVSTMTRTYIGNTLKQQFSQIGKKLRQGLYGSCFYPMTGLSSPVIYCARPGSRMWEVDYEGNVLNTHQFKALLDVPSKPLVSIVENSEDFVDNSVQSPGPQSLAWPFLQLCSKQYLLSHCGGALYILNPAEVTLVLWMAHFDDVTSVKCYGEDIYLLYKDGTVRCLSFLPVHRLLPSLHIAGAAPLYQGRICQMFIDSLCHPRACRHLPPEYLQELSIELLKQGFDDLAEMLMCLCNNLMEIQNLQRESHSSESHYVKLDSGMLLVKPRACSSGSEDSTSQPLLQRVSSVGSDLSDVGSLDYSREGSTVTANAKSAFRGFRNRLRNKLNKTIGKPDSSGEMNIDHSVNKQIFSNLESLDITNLSPIITAEAAISENENLDNADMRPTHDLFVGRDVDKANIILTTSPELPASISQSNHLETPDLSSHNICNLHVNKHEILDNVCVPELEHTSDDNANAEHDKTESNRQLSEYNNVNIDNSTDESTAGDRCINMHTPCSPIFVDNISDMSCGPESGNQSFVNDFEKTSLPMTCIENSNSEKNKTILLSTPQSRIQSTTAINIIPSSTESERHVPSDSVMFTIGSDMLNENEITRSVEENDSGFGHDSPISYSRNRLNTLHEDEDISIGVDEADRAMMTREISSESLLSLEFGVNRHITGHSLSSSPTSVSLSSNELIFGSPAVDKDSDIVHLKKKRKGKKKRVTMISLDDDTNTSHLSAPVTHSQSSSKLISDEVKAPNNNYTDKDFIRGRSHSHSQIIIGTTASQQQQHRTPVSKSAESSFSRSHSLPVAQSLSDRLSSTARSLVQGLKGSHELITRATSSVSLTNMKISVEKQPIPATDMGMSGEIIDNNSKPVIEISIADEPIQVTDDVVQPESNDENVTQFCEESNSYIKQLQEITYRTRSAIEGEMHEVNTIKAALYNWACVLHSSFSCIMTKHRNGNVQKMKSPDTFRPSAVYREDQSMYISHESLSEFRAVMSAPQHPVCLENLLNMSSKLENNITELATLCFEYSVTGDIRSICGCSFNSPDVKDYENNENIACDTDNGTDADICAQDKAVNNTGHKTQLNNVPTNDHNDTNVTAHDSELGCFICCYMWCLDKHRVYRAIHQRLTLLSPASHSHIFCSSWHSLLQALVADSEKDRSDSSIIASPSSAEQLLVFNRLYQTDPLKALDQCQIRTGHLSVTDVLLVCCEGILPKVIWRDNVNIINQLDPTTNTSIPSDSRTDTANQLNLTCGDIANPSAFMITGTLSGNFCDTSTNAKSDSLVEAMPGPTPDTTTDSNSDTIADPTSDTTTDSTSDTITDPTPDTTTDSTADAITDPTSDTNNDSTSIVGSKPDTILFDTIIDTSPDNVINRITNTIIDSAIKINEPEWMHENFHRQLSPATEHYLHFVRRVIRKSMDTKDQNIMWGKMTETSWLTSFLVYCLLTTSQQPKLKNTKCYQCGYPQPLSNRVCWSHDHLLHQLIQHLHTKNILSSHKLMSIFMEAGYWKGVIPLLHFGTYPDSHQSLPQIILQLADPDLLNPEKGYLPRTDKQWLSWLRLRETQDVSEEGDGPPCLNCKSPLVNPSTGEARLSWDSLVNLMTLQQGVDVSLHVLKQLTLKPKSLKESFYRACALAKTRELQQKNVIHHLLQQVDIHLWSQKPTAQPPQLCTINGVDADWGIATSINRDCEVCGLLLTENMASTPRRENRGDQPSTHRTFFSCGHRFHNSCLPPLCLSCPVCDTSL